VADGGVEDAALAVGFGPSDSEIMVGAVDILLAPGCIDDSLHLSDGKPPLLLHRVLW
jgi:hypothetical protein